MPDFPHHVPVLLEEALDGLRVTPEGTYIDCTFGRGGHSQQLLSRLDSNGKLYVLDQDPSAIEAARERYCNDQRVQVVHDSFANLQQIGEQHKLIAKVNGVFFDLGVSSPQLDVADRGFSFTQDRPLDMRMNTDTGITAAQWLEQTSIADLITVLREYGEEKFAKKIAIRVCEAQQQSPILTTKRLSDIVSACYPKSYQGIHPATRTFQAIRISINKELQALQSGLDASFEMLCSGGRLVVISFHSLEDRIVKRFIRDSKGEDLMPRLPVMPEQKDYLKSIGKLIRPSEAEMETNPRSRSAKMRVAEKVTM